MSGGSGLICLGYCIQGGLDYGSAEGFAIFLDYLVLLVAKCKDLFETMDIGCCQGRHLGKTSGHRGK